MLIHDFTKTSLFLFSRVIIHLTNGKSNITGPRRVILLLMHAIIKPDSLSYCCFDSCLLFKWKHPVSWQLMHRWPRSHSKQVEEKSIFVRRGVGERCQSMSSQVWTENFTLSQGEWGKGAQGEDADRHPYLTGLLGLGPSLLSLMMARQCLIALPCKCCVILYL